MDRRVIAVVIRVSRQAALAAGFAVTLAGTAGAGPDLESPVGLWRTYDDRTHQPRGVVRIFEKEGKLFGKIERDPDRKDDGAVCSACGDERKNQPMNGLIIIRNMSRDADNAREWSGGDVIDPDDGKIYRFRMWLEEGGSHLVVRGYIGFSLLGRSQTWVRIR